MKLTVILWIGIMISFNIQTIAQFNINAEIRPRSELRYGYAQLPVQNQTPAFFVSQRTRLSTSYKQEKVQFKLTLQDARVWGDENNLSFYDAWIKYQLSDKWNITIGRQELQYDGGRMIAYRNRRQEGFNYDAVVVKYMKDSLYFDFGLSVNNSQENLFGNTFTNAATQFKNFSFAYSRKVFDNGLVISGTAINSGFQKENSDTIYYKQTIGTKVDYPKKAFSIGIEGYYQMGKHKDGRTVNAYLVAATIGYKLSSKAKVILGAETTSGVNVNNTNPDYQATLHNFDILEGARFAYWGNANIFRNIEKHTAGGGLTDFYAKFILKPTTKSNITLTYFQFYLSETVQDNNSSINPNLGGELDILARYKVNKETTLSLGYSFILPTTSWEFVQNIPVNSSKNGHYVWIMLTSKLNLL